MTHPLAQRLAAGAPDWARRPMLAWDRDELSRRRPFVTASEWRAFSTIELPEIVGTAHPDYAGLSRTQLLAARRLRGQPLASPRLLGRDDGPGWSCERFVPVVALFYQGGQREQLTLQQVADRATALRRGNWLQRGAGWLRHALTHRPGCPRAQRP